MSEKFDAELTEVISVEEINTRFPLPNELKDEILNEEIETQIEHTCDANCDPNDPDQKGGPFIEPANLWTRKDIKEFKDLIKHDSPTSVIKIGHGETATIRVPTHVDGNKVYWEFATDYYDIGFGVHFEWTMPESDAIMVQITESDDEDEEEEEGEGQTEPDQQQQQGVVKSADGGKDVEGGNAKSKKSNIPAGPPTDEILPVFRRECHEEVHGGSHTYPGQGVYLLKFDNSYSLWRSKYLYYRIYYGE